MANSLAFLNSEYLKVFISIVVTLIGFYVAWYSLVSSKRRKLMINKYGEDQGWATLVISSKWIGGFTMGVMPLMIYIIVFPETKLSELGLGFNLEFLWETIIWTLVLGTIGILLARFNAKTPKSLAVYPQIRAKIWDRKMVRGNLIGWTVYMIGYEIMFRGVLLFPLVDVLGLWPAVVINIVISSSTHIQKGMKETLGAIPLALVFSILSIHTGSIWIGVLAHVAMALTNTSVALRHHPDMEIVKG